MEQPQGYQTGSADLVLRLNKALYGVKQAGRLWNQKLHGVLQKLGFSRMKSDASVYVYSRAGVRIIIPIFVDDITLAGKSLSDIKQVIQELSQHFKLRDLGPTSYLLGLKVTRNRSAHSLSVSQHQYILNMLDTYRISDCSPVSTPMKPGLVLSSKQAPSTPEEKQEMSRVPYINAVGSLMYLTTCTRPDIAYTVHTLARFSSNPGPAH